LSVASKLGGSLCHYHQSWTTAVDHFQPNHHFKSDKPIKDSMIVPLSCFVVYIIPVAAYIWLGQDGKEPKDMNML